MSSLKVALVQTSSTPDPEHNLIWINEAFARAAKNQCQLLVLPECALCWAKEELTKKLARSLEKWQDIIVPLSQKYNIAAVWGGLQVLENGKIYNTSLAYDKNGKVLACYEKTHLFQLFIKDKINIDETTTYEFGRTGPAAFELDGFKIGLTICYDLRFPELFREYAGHDAIICTAAFTKKTGRAHWEILLRARAIENQCYLLAAAQCGVNKVSNIQTYGHSMAIDPWGKILSEADNEPDIIYAVLDKQVLTDTQQLLPALKNRRL